MALKNYNRRWLVMAVALLVTTISGKTAADGIRIQSISAEQTLTLMDQHIKDDRFVILDIRTPQEYQQGHIAGAVLMDYYSPGFKQELDRLDKAKTYLIYCRSGNRSGKTMATVADLGFKKVYHLSGGILEWQARNLPLVKS